MTIISYAQNFEDVILWRALKQVKSGFYIDIGAYDPVVASVSLAFYEQGWRGVHVEPLAYYADKLRAARPDEQVVEAAIGRQEGRIPFFEITDPGLSTGDEAIAREHQQDGRIATRIEVHCLPLSSILDAHKDRDIHWLKIDVEGMEGQVIASWYPSPVRPWIVVVESTKPNSPEPTFAGWEPELLALGYDFVYFDGLNRFYVSGAHPELKASFGPGPNVFDGFVLNGQTSAPFCGKLLGDLAAKGQQLSDRVEEVTRLARALEVAQADAAAERAAFALAARAWDGASAALSGEIDRKNETLPSRESTIASLNQRLIEGEGERRTQAQEVQRLSAAHDAARAEVALLAQRLAEASRALEDARSIAAARKAANDALIADSGPKIEALAAREAEIVHLNRRIAETEDRRQAATAHEAVLKQQINDLEEKLAAVYRSTSWRVSAPLRVIKRAAEWFIAGTCAWLTLTPGSRPHRVGRRTAIAFINGIRQRPRLATLARLVLTPFPALQSRMRALIMGVKVGGVRDDRVDPLLESHLERVMYSRLIHARDTWQHCIPRNDRELPRLAYVSPLPPERSGVADVSAELLPELSKHYAVDVVVAQSRVADPWIEANCAIRDISWFEQHAHTYDRIVYHIGNSPFHHRMFRLLEKCPGVVVLHDFYLSNILAFLELHGGWNNYWTLALYHSHGYGAVRERFRPSNFSNVMFEYPGNLFVLQQAQGIIAHSDYSRRLAQRFYGDEFGQDWAIIPLPRRSSPIEGREQARRRLGLGEDDFLVCSFGMLGETKLNHRLVDAWLHSDLADRTECHLAFVGEAHASQYCVSLRQTMQRSPAREQIRITGFAAPETYKEYLLAADMAVQLRTLSRGETSAAVLDCMTHALPTIVNANGAMAELPRDCLDVLPDEFSRLDLSNAINELWHNPNRRHHLGERARAFVEHHHSPCEVARRYSDAIETFAAQASLGFDAKALAAHTCQIRSNLAQESDWLCYAQKLARETPWKRPARQLLLDVSALAREDLKTGIQRVVRSQLLALLGPLQTSLRVEPVWLKRDHGQWRYHYARRYVSQLMSFPENCLRDDPVDVSAGDVFFGADFFSHGVTEAASEGLYDSWRSSGVAINFQIYDLLPLMMPEYFPRFVSEMHAKWLFSIAEYADGVMCISRSVADELVKWLGANGPPRGRRLRVGWLHLGSDLENSVPTKGLPDEANDTLVSLAARHSFLMVGTIEPRKGYAKTLDAFERLWGSGQDVNLVIVGKQGWMVETLVERLRNHPELGKRLFWLEGISDEYLEKTYAACACLIAASHGEGFGLPLIEAARHKLPILARDIPVFREVAGGHASYFGGNEPDDLANGIENWLALHAKDRHPKSDDMPWLTWAQSAERLKAILLQGDWYTAWPSDEKAQRAKEAGGMTVMHRDCPAEVDNR